MRARVLVLSVAAHGVLAALLVTLATRPPATPRGSSVSIEVISVPPPPTVEPERKGSDPIPESRAARKGSDPISHQRGGRKGSDPFSDPRGEIRFESGDGQGAGTGRGDGNGVGLGIGDASGAAAIASLAPPPAPPPALVKVSKARPAILVYPKKRGTEDDPSIFVAQVTIDAEGYVVGAHVMRGEGGPRGQQASDLIWRFRYDPARDDDGRPIRSTLEQPFLVGR